jgi:hypothetical protein
MIFRFLTLKVVYKFLHRQKNVKSLNLFYGKNREIKKQKRFFNDYFLKCAQKSLP